MFFTRTVSLLITLLILFADSGQMIYAHTCLKSNNTSFSLYAPVHCEKKEVKKECCSRKHAAHDDAAEKCRVGKMNCCQVTGKFVKTSFPTDNLEVKKPGAAKDVLVVLPLQLPFSFTPQLYVTNILGNGPPLLPCNKQAFIQVFRC